jgi:GTPase SAR1 family protein/Tol biopolymer transport system component/SAM-dependent methyltransferase
MTERPDNGEIPQGFKLLHTLRGHEAAISRIAWSPHRKMLASPSHDGTIHLWDIETGRLCLTLKYSSVVNSVAWSPDGKTLASGADNRIIQFWDVESGNPSGELTGHSAFVSTVAWSPDGMTLASGSYDRTVRLWHTRTGKLQRVLEGHSDTVNSVAWSPDGATLASGSSDRTVRLWKMETGEPDKVLKSKSFVISIAWSPDKKILASAGIGGAITLYDSQTGQQLSILEGHTGTVLSLAFSFDGRFLASKSDDGLVRLWRCDTYESLATLIEPINDSVYDGSLSFHPALPLLATFGEADRVLRIWELDVDVLLGTIPTAPSVHYSNAKVVLVGDTGVGKSGLSLVLTGEPWVETGSTHGRRVWVFDSREIEGENGRKAIRETLLWDLAGQPDYRLIHQLHLTEVAVALVVFDSRSQTDPFAGVRHWDKALRQAQRVQGDSAQPMKKFLVAARADVGRVGISSARIESLKQELEIDEYFETSAKEGWNITNLAEAIRQAINWERLPIVSSTELFQSIKTFLVMEKEAGRLLSTVDDLYRAYLKTEDAPSESDDLRAQFETCIGRVESRGLIQRLSFGDLVLLQPELRDAYASAMVNAAKDEPDGLGCINEEKARAGDFRIPKGERIKGKEKEKLLLIATVEELLRHEIALREHGDDGLYLVFPTQLTRENPDLPDPEGKAVIFNFEGPVLSIYATLAVRLSHSGVFKRKEMWKNAATYTPTAGGTCGMFLREIKEGRGELTLFFDTTSSEEARFQFEEYINAHLQRRALPESINRRRIFVCPGCGTPVADLAAKRRRERGFDWIGCNVCDPPPRISLLDRQERLATVHRSTVLEMDRAADAQRQRETAASILQGKIATRDFDVFLCHNGADKPVIKEIGERLKERGILPWLDEWELRPGLPWQKALELQIQNIKSAAVFVGKSGIGPWQDLEQAAFLRQFVKREQECPVIPVILPDCDKTPDLPVFLEAMTWVDFRKRDPDPMERLVWGITGERDVTSVYLDKSKG